MERADRVNIIREALRVLAGQLQPQDTFSIITFARTATLRVDGVPGTQAATAAEEIAKLLRKAAPILAMRSISHTRPHCATTCERR